MRKIIISVAIMSLLTACGEKPTQEKADYAVISGKVSIPENQNSCRHRWLFPRYHTSYNRESFLLSL